MLFYLNADHLAGLVVIIEVSWVEWGSCILSSDYFEMYFQYDWSSGISPCTGYWENGSPVWATASRLCWWVQQFWVWRWTSIPGIWVHSLQWWSWYGGIISLLCQGQLLQIPWQHSWCPSLRCCEYHRGVNPILILRFIFWCSHVNETLWVIVGPCHSVHILSCCFCWSLLKVCLYSFSSCTLCFLFSELNHIHLYSPSLTIWHDSNMYFYFSLYFTFCWKMLPLCETGCGESVEACSWNNEACECCFWGDQ